MREQSEITKRSAPAVQEFKKAENEIILVPEVDIREDSDALVLTASMPGVDDKSADVSVENNVLRIRGRILVDAPQGYELAGQEFRASEYTRDFDLSDRVDTSQIKARMRNGVLDVRLPKRQEVRTRRVEITT